MTRREFFKKIADYAGLFAIAVIASSVIGFFRAPKEEFALSSLGDRVTLKGEKVSELLDSKKPVVLHFWGIWCPICKQEISTIDDLSDREDIILITIAVNSGTDDQLKRWMQERGVDFRVINDMSGILASKAGVSVFPSTLYYDSKGVLKFADSGYTTYAGFSARIELLK